MVAENMELTLCFGRKAPIRLVSVKQFFSSIPLDGK